MSMKRLALIAAVSSYTSTSHTTPATTVGSFDLNTSLAAAADSGSRSINSGFFASTGSGGGLYQGHQAMRPGATLHGNVNVLLGGAMMSVVITVLCVVCYCCHRNIKKRSESIYRQRWIENDANMEVYSVEQCYETSGLFAESPETLTSSINMPLPSHSCPPPSYDAVLAMDEYVDRSSPPPGYHNPGRKFPKNYTAACHSNVAGNYSNRFNKYNRSVGGVGGGGGATYLSESCCSLGRQNEVELNGRAYDVGSKPDVSQTEISNSLNNNNNNCIYEIHSCSLCGKSSRNISLSIDSGFENINADIQNGNQEAAVVTAVCSCYSSQDQLLTIAQQSPLILPLRIDSMNNHINNNNDPDSGYQQQDRQQYQQHAQQLNATVADLDTFNENGIIRMDMSQIIDKTGLPTYEAAIKLESSGYV